ncbi:DUF1014-domain-containing protein [Sistotremastrum suecicum HHB10207 ss-3]|uniref:DUF1014-domain-containing protein n=1 Tax=Sistotremastrum suecicum HHB10207 ss-3 TaxID=1314776 RepID=A0A166BG79_9AGAM|nr:DUF1014-domain-containing protein [Sistotremastrum suecicum HHB10207 ss-3]
MPPKGGNAKKESGRAKKAENEEKKKEAAAAAKEAKEANEWADGSKSGKSSKEEKEEKRRQEAAKKAERERLLAEEEASIASAKPKAAPKAGAKKGAASASGASSSKKAKEKEVPAGPAISSSADDEHKLVESFAATGIDDALDLLTVINAKADKASVGQAAAGLERHPERRFKAAFEAYQERELPIIKKDHPGLRLNQYKDLLFKQFQKSPDNPFNQVVVDYNASKEDKVSALKGQRDTVAERLRQE